MANIYICINQHICVYCSVYCSVYCNVYCSVYCSVYANQNLGKYPKDKSKRRRTSISVDSNPKLSWSNGLNEVHLDIERCHKYVQQIKMPNARLHKFYSPFFCMIVSLTAVDQRFSFKSSEISIFIQNIIPANKNYFYCFLIIILYNNTCHEYLKIFQCKVSFFLQRIKSII